MMHLRTVIGAVIVAGAFVVSLPDRVAAGTILLNSGGGTAQLEFYEPIGQSFTAEDPFVSAALFFVPFNPSFPVDPIRYDFYQGNGIGGPLLATTTFNLAPSFNGFFDFNLAAIPLIVGNRYTLVAVDVGTSPYWGVNQSLTSYAGGDPILQGAVSPNGFGGRDNSLRVTPSAVDPVPEPATLVLLGMGLVGQGLRRARRTAKQQQTQG